MNLPKIEVLTHQAVIPSTKKEITIRPFLVKEQKILLTALTGEDPEDIASATKQVVHNCIVTPGIDVDKLEIFDLEYLILQLRIVSVGETTKIRFLPRETTACEECKKHREIEINLRDANVDVSNLPDKKIQLTDKIGIMVRYPTTKMLGKIETAKKSTNPNDFFNIIWGCIECVFDDDKVISTKDVSVKEGLDFLESLNSQQFTKIEQFLTSMPKLQQKIHIKCGSCDFEQDFVLTGLENFFA